MVNIEIDEGSGFCFGVTTAIRKAEEELAKGNTLYCLGDIVHNGQECERLKKMGLITINHEEFAQLHDAKGLLRAHMAAEAVTNIFSSASGKTTVPMSLPSMTIPLAFPISCCCFTKASRTKPKAAIGLT